MNIKILVCYHKVSPIIANEVLQPILLGAENAKEQVKDELENLCHRVNVKLSAALIPTFANSLQCIGRGRI